MKKVSKLLGVLLTSAMLASAVPFGAAAEGGTVNLIPITDGSLWEAQAGDNDYKELNADGTWISAAIDSSGAVTLKRTANAKDGYLWLVSVCLNRRIPLLPSTCRPIPISTMT